VVDPYDPQSWNQYVYVSNNPLNSVDPLGLGSWGLDNGPAPSYTVDGVDVPASVALGILNAGAGGVLSGSYTPGLSLNDTGEGYSSFYRDALGLTMNCVGRSIESHTCGWSNRSKMFVQDPDNIAANNVPFSVSVYLPVAYTVGGYTYTYTHIAAEGQPTYNCSSHSATISTPAAKAAVSGGPLTLFGQSTQSAKNVISGWGWNFSLQASPELGYQVNINSSGVVGGFTFGVPGASASYGWGNCTRGN
jgi:hypothetical protein